jgi:hypothetical protein
VNEITKITTIVVIFVTPLHLVKKIILCYTFFMLFSFSLIYYGAIFFVSFLIFLWLGFKLYVLLQGPQFVSCSDERLKNVLMLARIKKGDRVADLGSGEGKALIAFAQKGAVCTGYEIDPFLVLKSRKKIKELGLEKHITIKRESFWNADISSYDVVYCYLVQRVMKRLAPKIQKGLNKNATFISVYCRLPDIKYFEKMGDVYLYSGRMKKG